MIFKRTIISAGLLVATSCTFNNTRPILSSGPILSVLSLATDMSTDLLFVGGSMGELVEVDPTTTPTTVTNSITLWNGAASNAVAMTPDPENDGRIWSLHADGWAVNWSTGPTMEDFFAVPIFGAGQVQCDIDMATDGDFYTTFLIGGNAWLGRRDSVSQSWNWAPITGTTCPRIAHDLYYDELYVMLGNGSALEHRDTDSLALQSSAPLDADGGAYADVDVFGSTAVGVGVTPPGPQSPAGGIAWHFDPDTGAQLDTTHNVGPAATSAVQLSIRQSVGKAEAVIGSIAGSTIVRGILLL